MQKLKNVPFATTVFLSVWVICVSVACWSRHRPLDHEVDDIWAVKPERLLHSYEGRVISDDIWAVKRKRILHSYDGLAISGGI